MANTQPINRVESFAVTVPAGTTQATPQVTSIAFDPGEVVHCEIDIPPGHNGLTGIQLRLAGGQVIPLTSGEYLTGNGRTFSWDLTGQPNSGAWQAYTYNTDIYVHSFHIVFGIVDFGARGSGAESLPLTPTPVIV